MKNTKLILLIAVILTLTAQSFAADGEAFSKLETDKKLIALTFDDGPHPVYTDEILKILDEYNVKATFFVIGKNAEKYPELVRAELSAGHEVENHTYGHIFANKTNCSAIKREISESEKVMSDICPYKFNFIRPPGGIYNSQFVDAIGDLSYSIVLWSLDTNDWKCPGADSIVNTVLSSVRPGDIVLMHDYVVGDSSTPAALKIILPKLLDEGYKFVTVSELMSFSESSE